MSIGVLDFTLPRPDFLNFGRTAQPDNELVIEHTMAPLSGGLSFFVGLRLQKTVTAIHQTGEPVASDLSAIYQGAEAVSVSETIRWSSGSPVHQSANVRFSAGVPVSAGAAVRWHFGQPYFSSPTLRWDSGLSQHRTITAPFDSGLLYRRVVTALWDDGNLTRRVVSAPAQDGIQVRYTELVAWNECRTESRAIKVLWDQGRPAPHGWRVPIIPLPTDGKAWGRLNFVCPAGGTLNFGNACFGAGRLLVAVRRSYRVINSAALIRVSDGADIPVSNLTVTLDWESWCWTLSATLMNRTAYETVPASPGLVQATINGFVWSFVVDDVDYSRAFGSFGGQLTGRSPIALLAEPYTLSKSYRETSLKTMQQLLLQELPGDFSLTVTLPDWTIPANVFQYENLTPMAALIRIAKTCGGRVYADKVNKVVYAVPKWPRKPWEWSSAAADVTLPSSYTLRENLQQKEGFEYEAVMVSGGVNGGVVTICKRAATGGLTHAPSAVDTLITHLDAAEPRAIQELADHWPMKSYTLELPLQASPAGAGLIEPGTVLDFADGIDGWRGLVVGVSINANWNAVQQTVELISP